MGVFYLSFLFHKCHLANFTLFSPKELPLKISKASILPHILAVYYAFTF